MGEIMVQTIENKNKFMRKMTESKQIFLQRLLLIVLVFCLFAKYSSNVSSFQSSSQLIRFLRCTASGCVGDAI